MSNVLPHPALNQSVDSSLSDELTGILAEGVKALTPIQQASLPLAREVMPDVVRDLLAEIRTLKSDKFHLQGTLSQIEDDLMKAKVRIYPFRAKGREVEISLHSLWEDAVTEKYDYCIEPEAE